MWQYRFMPTNESVVNEDWASIWEAVDRVQLAALPEVLSTFPYAHADEAALPEFYAPVAETVSAY